MRYIIALCVAAVISTSQITAQPEKARSEHYNLAKNVALSGFDPVSYFDGKPKEGISENRWTYLGITYQFNTRSNLEKFKASPQKYEPAYGGWCAYAMGENGEKVKIDPETYKIIDGRLYLFYNFWGNNTLKDWNKNEKILKEAGDRNWKKIAQ
ncbi:MAG: YHS domain protein [Cyclobacteriaceae bacterium]|nr:YHS domain protein [Cyclobacteriaceae bacterium]